MIRKLLLFASLLSLPALVFGQGVAVPPSTAFKVVNGITQPFSGATITVCAANTSGIPCSPVLTGALFFDTGLSQPKPNPFQADANGNYAFAISPGTYTITITGTGFAGYSYQMTSPGTGSGGGGGGSTNVFANGAVLGPLTFATLPASAANGTVAIVSDGTAGPACSDGGAGAIAYRVAGAWTCDSPISGYLGAFTVATLPAASAHTSQLVRVTDGTGSSDCATGGGSTNSLCMSNGSAWVGVGGGGTSIGPVFNLRNYGCVADDSTNNATCFSSWAAAVNAYSGTGIPEATCDMGPGDIAYKTSGGAAFTIPVNVRGGCVIDYSGTGDVFTLGNPAAVGFTAAQTPLYSVEGITFIGGGSAANGIHALHYASQIRVENNRFRNFGQGNATLGTCSTWAIKFDSPNNGIEIGRNWWWTDDSTQGRCFLSDVDTSGLGSNSTNVHDNHIYGRLDASTCAGVGVDITGNASKYTNNDTFAVALPIRIRGGLLTSAHNYIDNFNGACSAFGVEAAIEFGAPGAVSAIGNVSFTGDMINTTNVFAKAGDVTSASLNNMYVTSMLFQNASVMTSNLTCTQDCETNDLVNAPASGVSTFFTTGKQIVHGSTGYFDWTNYDRIIGVGASKSYKVQTNFAGTPVLREQILDGGEETHTIPTNFGFTLQTPLPATLLRITTGAIWSVFNTTRVNDFALMSSTEHSVPIVETAAALHATPVKVDTGTANHVTVTTTTDTAAGVVVGVLENVAGVGAGATANIVTTGIVPLYLGSGTCAIGQFVIVDTVGNAEVKCTSTYTAGTVIGVALQAQSTINQTLNVLVGLR